MTAAEDLAYRYLALWQDYVTTMPEAVQHWATRCSERFGDLGPGDPWVCGQLPAGEPAAGAATAPGHLASATTLWLTSRAALPLLKNASLPSNAVGARLRALAAEIEVLGAETVQRALDIEITRRADAYLAGVEAYRHHPFRRHYASPRTLWRRGTTQLLDYSCEA